MAFINETKAECLDCHLRWGGPTARGNAAKHTARRGHRTQGVFTTSFSYTPKEQTDEQG